MYYIHMLAIFHILSCLMVMWVLQHTIDGFPVNYFENLKKLKVNDKIIYITPYGKRTYAVILTTIIEETDWSYLQEYPDNRLTLITCVENKPSQRRCIQALEITNET